MNIENISLLASGMNGDGFRVGRPGSAARRRALWMGVAAAAVLGGISGAGSARAAEGAPVTLAWNANSEDNLAGYRVRYGLAAGTHTEVMDVGTETTVTLTGLNAATPYYVVVTAYNTAGLESLPSDEISFSPLAVPSEAPFEAEPLAAPAPEDPALRASAAAIGQWSAGVGGGFSFVITAHPGQTLAVYASPDMLNWELLGTTPNPTGRLQVTDHAAAAVNGRYYQVLPYAP